MSRFSKTKKIQLLLLPIPILPSFFFVKYVKEAILFEKGFILFSSTTEVISVLKIEENYPRHSNLLGIECMAHEVYKVKSSISPLKSFFWSSQSAQIPWKRIDFELLGDIQW